MSENKQRRMNAYYYGFEETGCDPIDDILEAVACAGKAYHHTDQWSNPDFALKSGELCETDKIQNAANASYARLALGAPLTRRSPTLSIGWRRSSGSRRVPPETSCSA